MRIVLDTTILVLATDKGHGPARDLLLIMVSGKHTLNLSSEISMKSRTFCATHGYRNSLAYRKHASTSSSDICGKPSRSSRSIPFSSFPPADVSDLMVLQSAVLGEADVLCTRDADFYTPPASDFLAQAGTAVSDEVYLLQQVRS